MGDVGDRGMMVAVLMEVEVVGLVWVATLVVMTVVWVVQEGWVFCY